MDINESLRYLNIGLPEDILRKKMYGDFEGAIRMIDRRLQDPNLPEGEWRELTEAELSALYQDAQMERNV